MRIADAECTRTCDEQEIFASLLPLDGARVLELGCGTAVRTRELAELGRVDSIVALEVDEVQHRENLRITDLPGVRFELGGAEAIPQADGAFDIVLMFKSLHHVPMADMATALREVHRVLAPGGVAYISEPVYAGEFNDILRLFHDEQEVRRAAFDAVVAAVDAGLFELAAEEFFLAPTRFEGYPDFERRVLEVTHTQHRLSPEVRAEVRRRVEGLERDGVVDFLAPIRVDLLRRR